VKSHLGPPMALGNVAAAHVRLIGCRRLRKSRHVFPEPRSVRES
jgi:hypothetical protein